MTGSAPRPLSHPALDLTSRSRMLTTAPVLLVLMLIYKKRALSYREDSFFCGCQDSNLEPFGS